MKPPCVGHFSVIAFTTAMMSWCVSFSIASVRSRVMEPEATAAAASACASAGIRPHSPSAFSSANSTLCSNASLCARLKMALRGVL